MAWLVELYEPLLLRRPTFTPATNPHPVIPSVPSREREGETERGQRKRGRKGEGEGEGGIEGREREGGRESIVPRRLWSSIALHFPSLVKVKLLSLCRRWLVMVSRRSLNLCRQSALGFPYFPSLL